MRQRIRALLVFLSFLTAGGNAVAQEQFAYRISFRDKAGAPALSPNPSWLSSRSIARRANFGIGYDSTDRPVSPVYLDSVLKLTGGVFHTKSRWLNQCVILVDDSVRIRLLAGKTFISNVEWVGYFFAGLHQKIASGGTGPLQQAAQAKTTGTSAYYGYTWAATDMVHGDFLHDQGLTGRGKLIAVIDEGFTGVDTAPAFDSLRNSGRLLETHNFYQATNNVFVNGTHGTSVLSPLAGYLPNTYVGSAPLADYALYITEDPTITDAIYEQDNLIAAMERADSIGADVISASLIYNFFSSPYSADFTKAQLDGHTTNIARAANLASAKGIVYVSSAGNEGSNGWNFLDSPGDADSALTVGSVNTLRNASSFSSPGPNSSGRVKPDVCLLGEPVPTYAGSAFVSNQSGTSFAAPQLAGYVACLLQGNPKARPAVIRNAVQRCSDRYNAPTAKLGYGIPDFRNILPYLNVPESAGRFGFSIGPNPFTDNIRVSFSAWHGPAAFRLFDPCGRVVSLNAQDAGQGIFMLSVPKSLPAGVYFLEAETAGSRATKRVVRLD